MYPKQPSFQMTVYLLSIRKRSKKNRVFILLPLSVKSNTRSSFKLRDNIQLSAVKRDALPDLILR